MIRSSQSSQQSNHSVNNSPNTSLTTQDKNSNAHSTNNTLNPFTQKTAIKTKKPKRQQGSSRFISKMSRELEPLPLIKGNHSFYRNEIPVKNPRFK